MTDDNINLQRVRYFNRQLLTANDFRVEQKYHREKLAKLVQRFPWGIVDGLEVSCHQKDDADDFDAFEIQPGLAVDRNGNAIVVGEALRVSISEFELHRDEPYLSLKYEEKEDCVGKSSCDKPLQNNRIVESIKHGWTKRPNPLIEGESWIAVAKIRKKTTNDEKKLTNSEKEIICGDYVIVIKDESGNEIRRNASLLQAEQIAEGAIASNKLEDGAVTSAKIRNVDGTFDTTDNYGIKTEQIRDGAVTSAKLAADIEARPIGDAGGDLDGSTYPNPIIKPSAVTSAKIADWEEGSTPETGIKTEHLQNGAVTSEKLDTNIEARPTGNAGGDLDGSTYPNPIIKPSAVTSGKIADWDGQEDSTTGITTEHLRDDAVTSGKIANWDGQEDSTTGIITEHLRDGAVTSAKIRDADGTDDNGIQTNHLRDGAVTSAKIRDADGTDDNGIQTEHLRDGAVTSAKIANWDGQENSTTGITTNHIRNGAVTPEKLSSNAVGSAAIAFYQEGSDLETGIKTEHIQNGAVNSDKLSLITIILNGTVNFDNFVTVIVRAEPNAIIQVIPTTEGELSWSIVKVKASSLTEQLEYTITITNEGTRELQYQIRKINLGMVS